MVIEGGEIRYSGGLPPQGDRLCVDFVNTVDWRLAERPDEGLASYADLVRWGRLAEVLTEEQATRLLALAADRPAEAEAVLQLAHRFREAMYQVFSAVIAGTPAAAAELAAVDAAVQRALCGLHLRQTGGHYELAWCADDLSLDAMLAPVAQSCVQLLTSDELGRLRQCAGDPCGWLFVDDSRNHSRRWCSMSGCGNRAKARRHYERHREPAQGQACG